MSVPEVEAGIYQHLYDFFKARKFTLQSDKKQFRQVVDSGFKNVIFSVTEYQGECWMEVNFGIRKETVEQIAQQFLDNYAEYRPESNTLVISIGKFNDAKYFRYKIQDPEDMRLAGNQIEEFLSGQGFSFMEDAMQIESLDKLLNHKPAKPCKFVYNQVHRCFKGLIAAKLANNPKLLRLLEIYRIFLEKAGKPTDIANYDRMANYLLHYSMN